MGRGGGGFTFLNVLGTNSDGDGGGRKSGQGRRSIFVGRGRREVRENPLLSYTSEKLYHLIRSFIRAQLRCLVKIVVKFSLRRYFLARDVIKTFSKRRYFFGR